MYRSAPLELKKQPEFLNAVAIIDTEKTPEKISAELKKIEKALKKNVTERFGPRTIDLDLLLYGQYISLDDKLTIPHLRLHLRRFVLEPLIELGAGNIPHPGFDRSLKYYLTDVQDQHCEKTEITI